MAAPVRHLCRTVLAGLAVAAIGGPAVAHDYIIVASSDPTYVRGQALDGGQRLALAPGRAVTLMHASGNLVLLKGGAGGTVAPARKAGDAEVQRLEVFRTMVAAKPRESTEGLGARRTRGGVCPSPESLNSLDAIATLAATDCAGAASLALEAWIAAHPAPED